MVVCCDKVIPLWKRFESLISKTILCKVSVVCCDKVLPLWKHFESLISKIILCKVSTLWFVKTTVFCQNITIYSLKCIIIAYTHTHTHMFSCIFCLRLYHVENTGSRLITKVKQRRACPVLGWVTTWEQQVL